MNLSKTLETINNDLVIVTLETYGFSWDGLQYMKSYLTDRRKSFSCHNYIKLIKLLMNLCWQLGLSSTSVETHVWKLKFAEGIFYIRVIFIIDTESEENVWKHVGYTQDLSKAFETINNDLMIARLTVCSFSWDTL